MKGQWFIISAVVASSIFLGMSFLLKDYFVVDSADVAKINNDFYLNNINEQLDNIARNTVTNTSCINLTTNLDEFKAVVEKDLASKSILARIDYKILHCDPTTVKFDFLVASDDEIIYNFTTRENVSEVIG